MFVSGKMSKFVEIPDANESLRQPASVGVSDDNDDNLSLASQDIELAVKNPSVKKSIKAFIKDKKDELVNFNAQQFVEAKKHEIQAFSLEEFMSDKRRVVIFPSVIVFIISVAIQSRCGRICCNNPFLIHRLCRGRES